VSKVQKEIPGDPNQTMKKCPNCNKKLYPKEGGGFYCKKCPFVNDPNWRKDANRNLKGRKLN